MDQTEDRRDRLSRERGVRAFMLAVMCIAATTPAARGQETPAPVAGLLEGLHLKAPPSSAPAFVTTSRPAGDMSFIPVGAPHPARTRPLMTPAEVAATEADLDAAREHQQRQAGHRPAMVPAKPTTAPPRKITVR